MTTLPRAPKGKISVNRALELTGYSRQQLYNLIRSGAVEAGKYGWQYWISRQSLEDYCRQRGKRLAAAE